MPEVAQKSVSFAFEVHQFQFESHFFEQVHDGGLSPLNEVMSPRRGVGM